MTLIADTIRVHVRFEGRSEDIDTATLRLAPTADDTELRAALAQRYDRKLSDLDAYVIVRESQAIIVRPVAFYG